MINKINTSILISNCPILGKSNSVYVKLDLDWRAIWVWAIRITSKWWRWRHLHPRWMMSHWTFFLSLWNFRMHWLNRTRAWSMMAYDWLMCIGRLCGILRRWWLRLWRGTRWVTGRRRWYFKGTRWYRLCFNLIILKYILKYKIL